MKQTLCRSRARRIPELFASVGYTRQSDRTRRARKTVPRRRPVRVPGRTTPPSRSRPRIYFNCDYFISAVFRSFLFCSFVFDRRHRRRQHSAFPVRRTVFDGDNRFTAKARARLVIRITGMLFNRHGPAAAASRSAGPNIVTGIVSL